MKDEVEEFLKELEGQLGQFQSAPYQMKLVALVRVYRHQNNAILDQNRRKGYPTANEWIMLADAAGCAEARAKEIVNG
jgi:hypothetical protein